MASKSIAGSIAPRTMSTRNGTGDERQPAMAQGRAGVRLRGRRLGTASGTSPSARAGQAEHDPRRRSPQSRSGRARGRASPAARRSGSTTPRQAVPRPKPSAIRSRSRVRSEPEAAGAPGRRADRRRGDQARGQDDRHRCGRFSTWLSSSERRCRGTTARTACPGTTSGNASRGATSGGSAARGSIGVRERDDQEPGEPGQLEPGEDDRTAEPEARPRQCRATASGRRSWSPLRGSARCAKGRTPPRRRRCARSSSGVPPATSRISSKSRRPALSTGSPSRIVPALRSMSSLIRSYIGVFVATLMHGVGLRPEHASAARREDQDVRPAGDQAGGAGGVVAGRVHEDQARACRPARRSRRRRPAAVEPALASAPSDFS